MMESGSILIAMQAKEIVDAALKAPVASLLIVVGIVFLAIFVAGDNRYFKPRKEGRIASCIIGALLILIGLWVHLKNPAEKELKASELVRTRPASNTASPQSNETYQLKTAVVNTADASTPQLGITVWRLRAATSNDDQRLLFQDTGDSSAPTPGRTDSIPERVEADTGFKIGDKVFLTLESSRTGYLYVIDRERYADGTTSEPYLIYPNLKTRNGDNRVEPGLFVRIPAVNERPNYFSMKPLKSDGPTQVGEQLSIIVTTQQVQGLPQGDKPSRLSAEQAAMLEGGSALPVERYEMNNGAGRTWTSVEKASSTENSRILTQEDPLPQTVYRVPSKPETPLAVKILLRYSKSP
jgi:hypothetical protein